MGGRPSGRLMPYALILPGGLWLLLFFVVPMIMMLSLSLQEGNVIDGYQLTWHWQTYVDGFINYKGQIARSLTYGLITTVLQAVIGFPLAYWIAFRGSGRKSMYQFLFLLPFFVSFVLRTISWKFILTDEGLLLRPLKEWGLLPQGIQILGSAPAVILGLTYNFLPFMVLPIYVALERVDPRVVEVARDLYASPVKVFQHVTFPLSLPGVFAGMLMSFVSVSSDYVNSALLGSSGTTMIGQVIQSQYLTNQNYPTAAALSFMLMLILIIGVILYAWALGSDGVLNVTAG